MKQLIAEFPDDERYVALLGIAKSGEKRTLPFPMSAFAVGDALCFLSFPHELFAEYQLFADAHSPFGHTFVFGYTNGSEVYVATQRAYELGLRGGYEAGPRNHALSGPYRLALEPFVEGMIQGGDGFSVGCVQVMDAMCKRETKLRVFHILMSLPSRIDLLVSIIP